VGKTIVINVFSRCCPPKIIKINQCSTELFKNKSGSVFETLVKTLVKL